MTNFKHRQFNSRKKSSFGITDEINKTVINRLKNIKIGDTACYGYSSNILKVVSVTPKLIICLDDNGNKILFHGISSVVPGIRIDDNIVTDDRLILIN
jgi:hypothetical protein